MATNISEGYVDTDTDSSPLIKLQSKDHEEILNVIDQLRAERIGQDISLPQLVVCGDQSSGKSSVLDAISGLSFPTKDNVCTRFATELILRRGPRSTVTASIYPDKERSSAEQERLSSFRSSTLELERFADIVSSAATFLGVDKGGYAKDVLRVEVAGPTQPDLTLVDLPGLYHAQDQSQDEAGVDLVESLVYNYMQNERSVVLVVISAKSDIALQKITRFTRKVDPKGKRTMGIITKPDDLSVGSDMEQSFYSLAKNQRVKYSLGWHVLKNRKYEERHYSSQERQEAEEKFLSQGIWASLPRSQCGVQTLRPRLSTILQNHILSELPDLVDETQTLLAETNVSLQKMGTARQTIQEQRRYLLQSCDKFGVLLRSAVDGSYFDTFFGDAMSDQGYQRRLRAVVQNRLSEFSDRMAQHGQSRDIIPDTDAVDSDLSQIHRSDFIEEVKLRMRRSRGRELPGTFNPLIIGDLFYLQSEPWQRIVLECIEQLLKDTHKAILPILRDVVDEKTLEGLLQNVFYPALEKVEQALRLKTEELLAPQRKGHPITYNHYFIETIQKTRQEHLRTSIAEGLKTFFGQNYPVNPSHDQRQTFCMNDLIAALGERTEQDMETFACTEAVDCMEAYYKVARKKFVDDFGNLAVEKYLIEPLLKIFDSGVVDALTDDVINQIAAEDQTTKHERARLAAKSASLKRCLVYLHRLDRHRSAAVTGSPSLSGEEGENDEGDNSDAKSDSGSSVSGERDSPGSVEHPEPEAYEESTIQMMPTEEINFEPVAEVPVDDFSWGVLSRKDQIRKDKKKKKISSLVSKYEPEFV